MRIALVSCVLLAGCVAAPQAPLPVLTADVAQQMPAAELCLGVSTFRPGNADVAKQEIQRRGINCQDHMQAAALLQQERAQQAAILLQQASQPLPPMPAIEQIQPQPYRSPMVQCTTRMGVGGRSADTFCH